MASGNWSPGRGRNGPVVQFLLVASLLLLHLIHPWTNLQSRHTAHSWKWFSVTAVHSQQKIVSLSDRNLQPRRRHGLRNSSVSLPLSVTMSPWLVTKPRWNAIWRLPKKNKFPRAHDPLQLRLRKSQSTFPVRRLVSNTLLRTLRKGKSVLEARTVSLQREESRLAELRAELVSVPANMDVDASEHKESEQQEIEQLRLLAAERCPIQLASKQKAVQDLQASIEAKRRRRG